MKKLILLASMVAIVMGAAMPAHSKGADRLFTRACPAPLQERLVQAKQFLVKYQNVLADDFEIDARRKTQENKAERQILRRVEKMSFKCKLDEGCDTHTALQSAVGGNTIRICAHKLYSAKSGRKAAFSEVVEVVAHEFGHNAHIPRARAGRHSRRGGDDPDRVYQFGYFAAELAREIYGTGFPVGEGPDPVRTPGMVPSWKIILYPHKDYKGHPIQFTTLDKLASRKFNSGRSKLNFDRWHFRHKKTSDLRFVGRNDAISSIVIKSGRWQICTDKGYRGTCKVVTSSIDNLKSIKMNNKISSIRYLGG